MAFPSNTHLSNLRITLRTSIGRMNINNGKNPRQVHNEKSLVGTTFFLQEEENENVKSSQHKI